VLHGVKKERIVLHTIKISKPYWIGHICVGAVFWNTLLKER